MQSSTEARFNPPPNWPPREGFEPEIGWKPDPSLPPPPPGWPLWILGSEPPRKFRRPAIVMWAAIAVVAALMVFFLVGPRHIPEPALGAANAPCALLIPIRAATDKDALIVTMRIGGICPGGTVLSQKTRVVISVSAQNVAAGTFDLTRSPIVVPQPPGGGSAEYALRDFRFPIGMFWRTPETLPALDLTATSASALDIRFDPVSQPIPNPVPARSDGLKALTPAGPAAPQFGDAEAAALSGLNAIADSDRQAVASLVDKWVPQLSARMRGDQVAGATFTGEEILKEHLKLRLSRPDVRLLRSSEWTTLNQVPDAWITVVGKAAGDGNGANAWCESNKFALNDCFARLLSIAVPPPDPAEIHRG
jgi:hypothetical protein